MSEDDMNKVVAFLNKWGNLSMKELRDMACTGDETGPGSRASQRSELGKAYGHRGALLARAFENWYGTSYDADD